MNKVRIAIVALIIAALFVSSVAEVILFYNRKMVSLNNQISDLKGQVSHLTTLMSANLETELNVTHAQAFTTDLSGTVKTYLPFNCLSIYGTVINKGEGTAFQAGLQIIGNSNGVVEVNMTVPLVNGGFYGTDARTEEFVPNGGNSPTQLGSLVSGQTATVDLSVYYECSVTNWTVTPAWTNTS